MYVYICICVCALCISHYNPCAWPLVILCCFLSAQHLFSMNSAQILRCVCVPQLQPNSASGSGALEHDPSSIYLRIPAVEAVPGPLPLGVSVIDASVALFGVVFPHVSFKHRYSALWTIYIYIRSNALPYKKGQYMFFFKGVIRCPYFHKL